MLKIIVKITSHPHRNAITIYDIKYLIEITKVRNNCF